MLSNTVNVILDVIFTRDIHVAATIPAVDVPNLQ